MPKRAMFHSRKYPHLAINQYGVVFAQNGHEDAVDYFGKSIPWAFLKPGPRRLDLQRELEQEAREAGYHLTHK